MQILGKSISVNLQVLFVKENLKKVDYIPQL